MRVRFSIDVFLSIENLVYPSLYVVCAGQRLFEVPVFLNGAYLPMLLVANNDTIITTANISRNIYIQQQKWSLINEIFKKSYTCHITALFRYSLLSTTSHKSRHFIAMVSCNSHKQESIIDDLFNIDECIHTVSRAFYIKS